MKNVLRVSPLVALPYRWKQTLQDVTVTIPVPPGTRSRDLIVEIKKTKLKVGLKGQGPIIDDDLCKEVKVDESTWTLGKLPLGVGDCVRSAVVHLLTVSPNVLSDDQKEINLSLEKVDQVTWWANVVKSAPMIDTTKITPENSKLSDLDGETRGMVEKMMVGNTFIRLLE